MIYFIKNESNGIKIGYSKDQESASRRLKALQTGSPSELYLMGCIDGDYTTEYEIHKRFAHYKLSGEWFEANDNLLKYIHDVLNITPASNFIIHKIERIINLTRCFGCHQRTAEHKITMSLDGFGELNIISCDKCVNIGSSIESGKLIANKRILDIINN